MIKENVVRTKIWSPTLRETQVKVDKIDRTKRIVLQGLTRQVPDMSTEELTSLTFSTVEKCLTKADKVILSLIVDREDSPKKSGKSGSCQCPY